MGRRRKATDSLDLFLDTICNAFGGIIFICILLSLLIQLRGEAETHNPINSIVTDQTSDEVRDSIAQLKNERHELEAILRSIEAKKKSYDTEELKRLQSELDAQRISLSTAMDNLSDNTERVVLLKNKNKEIKDEIDSIETRLAQGKAELEQLASTIQSEADKREFKVSVPRVRETDKSNLIYLIRYGQIYQVRLPNGSFNKSHVDVSSFLGIDNISPHRGAGWTINTGDELAGFKDSFRTSSPDFYFITIGVWSDSFKEFAVVKNSLIELGYDYDLFLIDDQDSVPLVQRTEKPSVQ